MNVLTELPLRVPRQVADMPATPEAISTPSSQPTECVDTSRLAHVASGSNHSLMRRRTLGDTGPMVLPNCLTPLTPEDKFHQNTFRKLGLRVLMSIALAVLVMYATTASDSSGGDGRYHGHHSRHHNGHHSSETAAQYDLEMHQMPFIFGTTEQLLLTPPDVAPSAATGTESADHSDATHSTNEAKQLKKSIYQQYQLHHHLNRRAMHPESEAGAHTSAGAKLGAELDQLCSLLHHSAKLDDGDHPNNYTVPSVLLPLSPVVTLPLGHKHNLDYIHQTTQAQLLLLSRIHTVQNVLSVKECGWIIEQTEKGEIDAVGNQWYNSGDDLRGDLGDSRMRELYLPEHTQDRPAASVPATQFFLNNVVYQILVPLLTEKFSLPLGRLGINSLAIVRIHPGGATGLQEHLAGGQFGFIIPLNDDHTGGSYVLTPNNNAYMERVYRTPVHPSEEALGRRDPAIAAYTSYVDQLVVTASHQESQRIIEEALDKRYGFTTPPGSHSSSNALIPTTGTTTLVLEKPTVGSAILFTAKTMLHKTRVSSGMRYALVGSMGYVEEEACEWFNQRLEKRLERKQQQQEQEQEDEEEGEDEEEL